MNSLSLKTPEQAYDFLLDHYREIAYLSSTASLLHWDQSTYIPQKGRRHRAEQLAFLAGLVHQRRTSPQVGEALAIVKAGASDDATGAQAVNCREWRRDYDRAGRIPTKLAVALAKAAALSEMAWEEARPLQDWPRFKPHLENILRLKIEEAHAVGFQVEPYDALLDEYEPGETAGSLESLFAMLKGPILDLLQQIMECSRVPDTSMLHQNADLEGQKALIHFVLQNLGLDMSASRMDSSAHPFSSMIGPGDVRLTTRFDRENFTESLYSAIHEMGHGLYDLGLPEEHWGEPTGSPCSMGIHESQSRLWENFVGRSLGFWKYFLPKASEYLPHLKQTTAEDLCFAINDTRPGFIRTEADQLTYNLHIILRFELELALLRGDLSVVDLPEAFNEKMRGYLGLTPPDCSKGVMQDVHWAAGLFGYFPSYALGNLYAAQIFQAAREDLGDLDEAFSQGEFTPLLQWLGRHIHSQGMRYSPRDLVVAATGRHPSPQTLIDYLESTLGGLYGV